MHLPQQSAPGRPHQQPLLPDAAAVALVGPGSEAAMPPVLLTFMHTCTLADVPGLLEGAHEGLGLGHEFLRHVQRCRVLVHVVDGTSPDPVGDFNAINLELELFNPDLKDKPQLVAYNKVDLPDSGDFWELVREQLVQVG